MVKESDQIPATPQEVCPLMAGAPIPSVTIRTIDGSEVNLAEAVREKPSILIFYRGGW
jgi:peroxiredoxin